MDIVSDYMKVRSSFGRQVMFCEQAASMCDSIAVEAAEHARYMLRNPVSRSVQHTPRYSAAVLNTTRADYTVTGANHSEGGWPRDVHVHDPEVTQRYRRKVEKDETYLRCVNTLTPSMDHLVLQNNAIDMYQSYFSELEAQPEPETVRCRTVNVYRAPGAARAVSSICWEPEGTFFAVTYNNVDLYRTTRSSVTSYIWDLEDANGPHVTIEPPVPLIDLKFNPRDTNLLVGGLIDGQVAVWDRRMGGDPTVTCASHVAHRDLVRNVLFIHSKSGQEFFSGGADGVIRWWDIRNMTQFTDEVILDTPHTTTDVPNMATANGISSLEFEPTIPTRYMVGTENGYVFGGNRKGKNPLEKLPSKFDAQIGPVWALQRNPGFLKNFLTVGDWTARIWAEDCRESAVMWTEPKRHKITDGTWSPTRYSLMLLTQWNGLLTIWDLLRRQHEPVVSMQLCSEPLLRLQFHEAGGLVACGSQSGKIYMVEVSKSLTESDKNDKSMLTAILDRENKRERILEARLREIRLKQRQAEGSPRASLSALELPLGDRDLVDAANDFFATIKKEKDIF